MTRRPAAQPQIDLDQRHNRAIAFLRKKSTHKLTVSGDGTTVELNGKTIKLGDLHKHAADLYGDEWRKQERQFSAALRGKRT